MKKYLSLFVILSLVNSSFSMEVDTSATSKVYSIEAADGVEFQFPESLVNECQTLINMLDDLDDDSQDEAIPIPAPSTLLQSLIDLHSESETDRNAWFIDKLLPERIDLFKIAFFLGYSGEDQCIDAVIRSITTQETLKALLKNEIALDVSGCHEDVIKAGVVHILQPFLTAWYRSQNNHITLKGHTDGIHSVYATPDGKNIITGSRDTTAKIWNRETGDCECTLEGHTGWITSVCVTPDGKSFITGSRDATAKIWNRETGACEHTLIGHTGSIWAVCVTPDGKSIITGSDDNTAKIWNRETGACECTLEGHTDVVSSICVTPDGKNIITGSDDKTVKIWNRETSDCECTLEGHTGWITSVYVTPDGKSIITGSDDNTAKIWNRETGASEHTLKGHKGSVWAVCVTPDGKSIITGSDDKTTKIWNRETGDCEHTLKGRKGSVISSVCITPDGKSVITGSYDKTAKIWEVYNPNLERILLNSSLHMTLLCYYAFTKPEAAKSLIGNFEVCKDIYDNCDPEIKKIISASIHQSLFSRIFTPRNILMGAGSRIWRWTLRSI